MMVAEPVVATIKVSVAKRVENVRKELGRSPKLVAVLIGDDPVSRTYVDLKRKDCAEVGIESEVLDLSGLSPNEAPRKILQAVRQLNDDDGVDAVIPQMPFSGKISEELVFSTLSPRKDVDGLTPQSLGKLVRGEYDLEKSLLPCTPKGVVLLLKHYLVNLSGADVGIVGRSTLVGEPLRKLFQDQGATATCFHTKTKNLLDKIKSCDVVVAASGRPPEMFGSQGFRLIGGMVREGSTVVSVGVRKDEKTGKMLFDVDTKSMKGVCSFLTPNTGGVGAMTRAVLLQNTVNSIKS
jgi:methylenetetrahydrofolate dehydrogenase (NADP+) / methenyltetrahydrofolate cyclohydrolase